MWRDIKRGFGWAFGGRLGWELGGVVWRLLRRLALGLAVAFYGLAQSCQPPAPPKAPVVQKQHAPAKAPPPVKALN